MKWVMLAFMLVLVFFLALAWTVPVRGTPPRGDYIPTPNNFRPVLPSYPPPGEVITFLNDDYPPGGYVTWLADNTSKSAFYLSNWGHSPKNLVEFTSHGIGKYRLKR